MRNIHSLKTNKEFRIVYSKKHSFANKYLIMYVLENKLEKTRLGISVSKKVGNSVVRHRVTRLIRESFRLNQHILKNGIDIIIVARPLAKEQGFKEIESAMLHLSKMHHILDSNSKKDD